MTRWMLGVAIAYAAAGCDPWPTQPRDASRTDVASDRVEGVDAPDVPAPQDVQDVQRVDVQDAMPDADASVPDVSTSDASDVVDAPDVPADMPMMLADVQGPDAQDVQDVPLLQDVPPDRPDAGGLRVVSQGIVTVGPSPSPTGGGGLRVIEQGFEYGSAQCNTGTPLICWTGGIVP